MVNKKAQTFTLEGIAASLLLLITTYAVFQSSVIISPSWGELESVQLKQIGYDVLRVIDVDDPTSNISLRGMLTKINLTTDCDAERSVCSVNDDFATNFSTIMNSLGIEFRIEVLWLNENNTVNTTVLNSTSLTTFSKNPTSKAVSVDRIVLIDPNPDNPFCSSPCAVEVRLTLWKV
jgi:hypothetical protein